MTPVHFMGREIGWFVTDRLGVCRYKTSEQVRAMNSWMERMQIELRWKGKVNGIS